MRYEMPLLKRLLTKLVHDVLPAALASVIGGFLFTHLQLGRLPEPVAAQVAPASDEMMQLLRDEHGLIISFIRRASLTKRSSCTRMKAPDAVPPSCSRGQAIAGSRASALTMAAVKAQASTATGAALATASDRASATGRQ